MFWCLRGFRGAKQHPNRATKPQSALGRVFRGSSALHDPVSLSIVSISILYAVVFALHCHPSPPSLVLAAGTRYLLNWFRVEPQRTEPQCHAQPEILACIYNNYCNNTIQHTAIDFTAAFSQLGPEYSTSLVPYASGINLAYFMIE